MEMKNKRKKRSGLLLNVLKKGRQLKMFFDEKKPWWTVALTGQMTGGWPKSLGRCCGHEDEDIQLSLGPGGYF